VKNFRVTRLLRLIGPYPFSPYLIFLFFFALFFSRFIPVIVDQPRGIARWVAAIVVLMISLIPSSLFAIYAFLIQKYRRWSSQSLTAYICEVALGQSIMFICTPPIRMILLNVYNADFEVPATFAPGPFVGTLLIVLLSLGLMHRVERTIAIRLLNASELVAKLEIDRAELIKADEAIREQTSQFLHNRVQSDLMVIGIKLRKVSGQSSRAVNEVIDSAIRQLENTRTSDLRNLIQILTPNFDAGSLQSAIDSLLEQYRTTMEVVVEISGKTEALESEKLLGIFRIVEQALINSLVHGPAKKVLVSARTNEAGRTELHVSDDGPGVEQSVTSTGVGTAVIDSWTNILKGKKEIVSMPGRGYRLVIMFPI
jgi:signal transduction histidine kinase